MLPGDGPVDPPTMSDGEYIKRLEADVDRLRKELKAEQHETEEWKHVVSNERVMARAAQISRQSDEIKRLQAIVADLKRQIQYRDDIIGLSPNGDRHAHLVSRIEELQTIVGRLPVDANSTAVVPRIQDVWHPDEPRSGTLMDEEEVEFDRTGDGDWHYRKIGECYGTQEAAEAAAEAAKSQGKET